MGGDVGGEFIVTAAGVLDERMASGQDPPGPVTLEYAHWPQPRFQPSVIVSTALMH
jgi:hypothetical protein